MIKITRIDLADFTTPDRIAGAIIQHVSDLPIPVPVEEIACMLDIISIEPLTTEGFEGSLLTDPEKSEGYILVNEASPPQRRRFTVGHELGHFLCPFHKPPKGGQFLCSSDDMRLTFARKEDRPAYMEIEANRFAALLLMPLPHFRKDLRFRKGVDMKILLPLPGVTKPAKRLPRDGMSMFGVSHAPSSFHTTAAFCGSTEARISPILMWIRGPRATRIVDCSNNLTKRPIRLGGTGWRYMAFGAVGAPRPDDL